MKEEFRGSRTIGSLTPKLNVSLSSYSSSKRSSGEIGRRREEGDCEEEEEDDDDDDDDDEGVSREVMLVAISIEEVMDVCL